jgi:PAS domain S-box-containing protein
MVLAATGTDVTSQDSTAFARAMGNQLAQSLELTASFARVAASERRYRTLTDNAHDAIAILTTDGSIREVNIRMEELVGFTRQELAGRSIREFAAPVPEGEVVSFSDLATRRPGRTQQVSLQAASGGTVLMEFSAANLDVGGDHLIFAIGRDVTEQVKTQAQLMVADRMASIGMMAAGVAHEINNPLAAVTMNLHLAADELEAVLRDPGARAPQERLTEELRDAREAASRVRDIVQDLKIFSRQEEDRRGAVDLSRVLDSALRMARNELRHRAQVVKDYAQVPLVLADESRLGQVFLNLLVNAAQAVPEGHADANEIRVRTRTVDADWVRIDISDTGHGMSPHVLSNLFTPFFTTKPTGIGTGLGLAICHRIITSLGGEIEVESRVGTGTTFSVTLPVASVEDEIAVAIPSTPPGPNRQRGRVLVVDDDSVVGVGVSRLLSPNHDVEVVTSAAKALDIIRSGLRFDVILCDLMMPVMDGVELHEALSASEPDQARRMIFLTAGAFTPRARSFLDRIPNARLEKPFELQTLRALVNERTRSGLAVGD